MTSAARAAAIQLDSAREVCDREVWGRLAAARAACFDDLARCHRAAVSRLAVLELLDPVCDGEDVREVIDGARARLDRVRRCAAWLSDVFAALHDAARAGPAPIAAIGAIARALETTDPAYVAALAVGPRIPVTAAPAAALEALVGWLVEAVSAESGSPTTVEIEGTLRDVRLTIRPADRATATKAPLAAGDGGAPERMAARRIVEAMAGTMAADDGGIIVHLPGVG